MAEREGIRVQEQEPGTLVITMSGRLDAATVPPLWKETTTLLERRRPQRVLLDAEGITYCDGTGIALLAELNREQERRRGEFWIRNLPPQFGKLFELYDPLRLPEPHLPPEEPSHLPEEVGRGTWRLWEGLHFLVSFLGEVVVAFYAALRRPRCVRWRDALTAAEKAGVNGLPIVLLVSFLVGLIMAFQAAIPMRQFGTEIYVANLVGLAMIRELGPLMTAMVLAGRTGSAFAAELGTMKVNEEIDALVTMGLDPVRFLVVNRILAAVLVVPLLTVFADVVGVLGGAIVLVSLGYPVITYVNQVLSAVTLLDFATGLFKSLFFGGIVAGIGCMHGLLTRTGPSAVGDSATRAVVAGNVLIIVTDGIFSVLFYYLGI